MKSLLLMLQRPNNHFKTKWGNILFHLLSGKAGIVNVYLHNGIVHVSSLHDNCLVFMVNEILLVLIYVKIGCGSILHCFVLSLYIVVIDCLVEILFCTL